MNLTLGCHLIREGGALGGDLTLQAFCDQSGFGVRVWDCHLGKLRTSKKLPNYEICHYAKEELVFLDVCTIRGVHYDAVGDITDDASSAAAPKAKRASPGERKEHGFKSWGKKKGCTPKNKVVIDEALIGGGSAPVCADPLRRRCIGRT